MSQNEENKQQERSFRSLLHEYLFPHIPYPQPKGERDVIENAKWTARFGMKFVNRWNAIGFLILVPIFSFGGGLGLLDIIYFGTLVVAFKRLIELQNAKTFLASKNITLD